MSLDLRSELTKIYEEQGQLTPKLVVEAARPNGSPLHSLVFDCVPKVAAERYYLDRAHKAIQQAKIVFRNAETSEKVEVRAFHAVQAPEGHVYRPTNEIVDDPLLKALVLRDMEREWRQMHARYSSFIEFTELIAKDLGIAV